MRPRLPTLAKATVTIVALAALAACQSPAPRVTTTEHAALPTMERVMLGASACWFKSGDPAFATYQMAPELDSYSGRPRILIVPRSQPGGRPLLVVQAEGSPARMEAFGPMMTGAHSARITTDVNRWAGGAHGC